MGVVYKARQVALGRLTALKVLLTGAHASPEDQARFHTEARAVADLQHPNIVQVYGFGEHDGKPYLALEYLDGGSLRRFDNTPQEARTVARVVETLSRAVQHAHDKKIVHRDLKPGNILLNGSRDAPLGQCVPKVADFGLAKRLGGEDPSNTATHAVLGTPAYMAPEQARGRAREVGPAADVYGLGAILYQLLTGLPPFRAASAPEALFMVQTADPLPPRQVLPTIPLDLQTICLKCLEKDPARRYLSAGELADDLARFLSGEPIRARPTPPWERAWKLARRRPALAALIATGVVALVLLIVVGGLLLEREKKKELEKAYNELREAKESLESTNESLESTKKELTVALGESRTLGKKAETEKMKAEVAEEQALKDRGHFRELISLILLMKHEDRARYGELLPASKKLLRLTLETARQVADEKAETDKARLFNAEKSRLVADWEDLLGNPREAEESYRRALGYYQALPEQMKVSDRELSPPLERIETLLGLCKVLQRPPGPDDWNELKRALGELNKLRDGEPGKALLLGRVYTVRAHLLARLPGERPKAEADYREAIRVLTPSGDAGKPAAANGREREVLALAQAELSYGALLARSAEKDQHAAAASLLERAREQLTSLLQIDKQATVPARELARVTANLATVKGLLARDAEREKRLEEAQNYQTQARNVHADAVKLARKLDAENKGLPDYGCLLVTALIGQAQNEVLRAQAGAPLDLETARKSVEEACTRAEELYREHRMLRVTAEARVRAWHVRGGLLLLEYQRLLKWGPDKETRQEAQKSLEKALDGLQKLLENASDDPGLQQELDELDGNLILCSHLAIEELEFARNRPLGQRKTNEEINQEMLSPFGRSADLYRDREERRRQGQVIAPGYGVRVLQEDPTRVAALVGLWALGAAAQATTPWSQALQVPRFGFDSDVASALLAHAQLLEGVENHPAAAKRVEEIYRWTPPEWEKTPAAVVVLTRCLSRTAQARQVAEREKYVRSWSARILRLLPERPGPAWRRKEIRKVLSEEASVLEKQANAEGVPELRGKLLEVAKRLRDL
jgi:serine/threonine protein kinase